MTTEDRNRADARYNRAARAANDAKPGRPDGDVAAKAVLDNRAKLKAWRLAREAAAPPPAATVKKARAKPKKSGEKGPALADWLAGQQSGGGPTQLSQLNRPSRETLSACPEGETGPPPLAAPPTHG